MSQFKRVLIFLLFCVSTSFAANNMHLIDQDESGFAIYRISAPNYGDMKELCNLGVEEIIVLSGNAQDYEYKYESACPSLKVVYNEKQKAKIPVTKNFLTFFDEWVSEAKRTGKKIAFRCNCGCHRTGRLAAYYQMKYQRLTVGDATVLMKKHGKYMIFFRFLNNQLIALEEYIKNQACSQGKKYCVRD
jgi:hypothetical protein